MEHKYESSSTQTENTKMFSVDLYWVVAIALYMHYNNSTVGLAPPRPPCVFSVRLFFITVEGVLK